MTVVSVAVVLYGVYTARQMRREAYRPLD